MDEISVKEQLKNFEHTLQGRKLNTGMGEFNDRRKRV